MSRFPLDCVSREQGEREMRTVVKKKTCHIDCDLYNDLSRVRRVSEVFFLTLSFSPHSRLSGVIRHREVCHLRRERDTFESYRLNSTFERSHGESREIIFFLFKKKRRSQDGHRRDTLESAPDLGSRQRKERREHEEACI
jgi:hypothetical protein